MNNNVNLKKIQGAPWWLVVRVLGFHCHGRVSIFGGGTEILQGTQCSQKKQKAKIKKKIQCFSLENEMLKLNNIINQL